METYISSVIFIILFIAIADLLTLNGKNGKLTKIILSLICVIAYITPIFKLVNGNNDYSLKANSNYDSELLSVHKSVLETEVKSVLNIKGYSVISVDVLAEYENNVISTKKVEVYYNCNGINCETTHINITTETKNVLNERFSFDDNGVEIIVNFIN